MVLPVGEAQGLDLADVGDVAVDPGAGETDEHPQGARAPAGICREGGWREQMEYEDTERVTGMKG